MDKSLCISLIHNNNEDRLSLVTQSIKKLSESLDGNIKIDINEFSYQPMVKPVSFRLGVFRDLLYWNLNRKWNKYIKQKNRFLFLDIFIFIFRFLKKYIINYKIGKRWLKTCSVEMFVTDKHVRSIFLALDNDFDYLLVFEDDAIFKNDSIKNISFLLNYIKNNDKCSVYADLAGGISLEVLEYDKILLKKDNYFRYFKKPVTNTACCYLMNREQLRIFGDFLICNPKLRYIGVDWLFNKMFIMQLKIHKDSLCIHSDPTFFQHGSTTGEFKPWAR